MNTPDHKRGAATFPSPKERERIVRRRKQLSYALYRNIALRSFNAEGADARTANLVREYGADEVRRMIERIGRQLNRPKGDAEEPWLYADYVARYRRFGGSRPLLSFAEQQALNEERAMLLMRHEYGTGELNFGGGGPLRASPLSAAEERRLADLSDLLLANADLWDDLVPEDPPAVLPPLPPVPPESDPEPLPAEPIDDLVEQGHRLLREMNATPWSRRR